MNNKDITLYPEAFELKQLGFDEPCFGWYDSEYQEILNHDHTHNSCGWLNGNHCTAPTYSQAFRFFREKHGLCIVIKPIDDKKLDLGYSLTKNGLIMDARLTYEGAELACLRKLIEIVKNKR
jgi:hypothetical protein